MRILIAIVTLGLLTSCGKRVPEPVGVAPGTPHVSWIIMHGDRDNPDAEFACQSTGPTECSIPASTPAAPVYSDVHLYYHGAGAETVYVGSYELGHFQRSDASSREVPTRMTVRGEERIANQSVTGIVTSTPGIYALRLNLEASTRGSGATQAVRAEVPVTVRPAPAQGPNR